MTATCLSDWCLPKTPPVPVDESEQDRTLLHRRGLGVRDRAEAETQTLRLRSLWWVCYYRAQSKKEDSGQLAQQLCSCTPTWRHWMQCYNACMHVIYHAVQACVCARVSVCVCVDIHHTARPPPPPPCHKVKLGKTCIVTKQRWLQKKDTSRRTKTTETLTKGRYCWWWHWARCVHSPSPCMETRTGVWDRAQHEGTRLPNLTRESQ